MRLSSLSTWAAAGRQQQQQLGFDGQQHKGHLGFDRRVAWRGDARRRAEIRRGCRDCPVCWQHALHTTETDDAESPLAPPVLACCSCGTSSGRPSRHHLKNDTSSPYFLRHSAGGRAAGGKQAGRREWAGEHATAGEVCSRVKVVGAGTHAAKLEVSNSTAQHVPWPTPKRRRSHDCSSGALPALAAVKLAASGEHFHSCTLLGMTCRVLFRYGLGHMPSVPPCGAAKRGVRAHTGRGSIGARVQHMQQPPPARAQPPA